MNLCGNTGDPTRKNLAGIRCKKDQHLRILVINLLHLNIETPPGHLAVRPAEIISSLFCLRFHRISNVPQSLSQFTMERPALKEWVVFHLLKATGRSQTFLITGSDIS